MRESVKQEFEAISTIVELIDKMDLGQMQRVISYMQSYSYQAEEKLRRSQLDHLPSPQIHMPLGSSIETVSSTSEAPKEEVKEEKPKKTTKKKASTKKKKEEPKKEEESPVEEVKAETFSKEDISSACQKLAEKHGLVKAKELLESFGAKRVSDVPEAKYPEFMQAASEAM